MPTLSLKQLFFVSLVVASSCIQPQLCFSQLTPVFFPGTGNYYALTDTQQVWTDAEATASSFQFGGVSGRLATVTSQEENDFLTATFSLEGWIGGFQPIGSPEPAGGFQWITDEVFEFENFGTFEPNNNSGNTADPNERFLALLDGGTWNDLNSSVALRSIIEFETSTLVAGEQGFIINGSFEEGDFGGNPSFRRLAPGDTELTGWTIGGVAVDWHNAVEFNFPNSGDRVLDLHLDGGAGQVGTISQSFTTDVGERYILEFFLSGPGSNFGFPDPRSVNVDVAGVQQTFSAPASLNTNLQWSRQQLVFSAVDSTTTLTFSSPLNGIGFWGPVLDDVSVVLAPEVILGNVNLDGEVGLADVPPFIDVLKAGAFLEEADVNQDGVVNFSDIPAFIAILVTQILVTQ